MRSFGSVATLTKASVVTAGVGLMLLGTSACGGSSSSGSKPAGLSGSQVQALDNSQFSAEDRAAATVLKPAAGSFLAGKTTDVLLGSTTPNDGDINPYAIWPVTRSVGSVRAGDILVDNFNNKSNDQGTGTTIVDVHPDKKVTVFADLPRHVSGCPGGVGLDTAMVQLRTGWVIVGSVPTANGKVATAKPGCLIVLSSTGKLVKTIAGSYLDGPWDATVADHGATAQLYLTTTLAGVHAVQSTPVDNGTVVRLDLSQTATTPPTVTSHTVIASGFGEKGDAAALVKGPTGLALGSGGQLYVADTLGDRVASIPHAATRTSSAGTGTTLSSGGQLANPLGLVRAPDGDLIAANAENGKLVEITPAGKQVGEFYAIQDVGQDPPGNGDLFGVAISPNGKGIVFVEDDTNTLAEVS